MAKISELTETTSVSGTEKVPLVQSGTTKFIQASNLLSTSSVDINGGTIDNTTIGATTAAAGTFSALTGAGWTMTSQSQFQSTLALDKALPTITLASTSTLTATLGAVKIVGDHTITASTTQTQGQQALTRSFNVVTTCTNANDVVTLPAAAAGLIVFILNLGAQTLQVFPASGDAIGTGAGDASTTQTTKTGKLYIAGDSTTWCVF